MNNTQISKEDAQALLDNIRNGLINVEKNLIELVKVRGWEPLGYETFSQMWKAELDGVPLARAMSQAHVAWALFAEKMPDADIQELLGGKIGDAKLRYMREQFDVGVPANLASVTPPRAPKADEYAVSAHIRSKPRPAQKIHTELTAEEYDEFVSFAKKQHKSVPDFARDALQHYMALCRNNVDLNEDNFVTV